MKKERIALICDADYTATLAKTFELKTGKKFDFQIYLKQLMQYLSYKRKAQIEFVLKVAYGSVLPEPEDSFRKELFSSAGVHYKPFPRKPNGSELGVDATIGFQIGAAINEYDILVLITGDGDFAFTLNAVGKKGVFIMTVPLRGSSNEMLLQCSTPFPFDTYIDKNKPVERPTRLIQPIESFMPRKNYNRNAA